MKEILYLKLSRDVETDKKDIVLSDLGKLVCKNKNMLAGAKAMRVYSFHPEAQQRCVISVMKIIEKLENLYPELTIENIGETEVLVEHVKKKKDSGPAEWIKIAFVSLICFFGTAFTLMAFHNDIGVNDVFSRIYEMVYGRPSDGLTVMEVSYSLGLAVGILVFFNHIGSRQITKDPTPIEVEMRVYEDQVNTALVETADREGKMIDVS